jgi:hypothetical protein
MRKADAAEAKILAGRMRRADAAEAKILAASEAYTAAMKCAAFALLLWGGFWVSAAAQCVPTAKTHQRWDVKTRATPTSVTTQATTVADMIAEDVPTVAGLPDTEISNSDEQTVFALTGYVMLAKRAPDDCDIHMEIADKPSTTAPRVVVEVPPTLPDVQSQLIAMLALKKGTKTFTKATAPQLHFQGYGFFDLSHRATSGGKKGHNHGSARVATLLEIHPLWGIVRATP